MEQQQTIAEVLPELYRQVLDRVASLEHAGYRGEAARVRADATRIYSGPWTEAAVGKFRGLRIHAERVVSGRERPRAARPWASALARLTLVRSA